MTTPDATLSPIPDAAVEALAAQAHGKVLRPSDPGYADVREPFNVMHRDQPGLVVSCADTADVVQAVRAARKHGARVAVRGGGHSFAGLSTIDGGMLIDLAPMSAVEVDSQQRLARVQGGARGPTWTRPPRLMAS